MTLSSRRITIFWLPAIFLFFMAGCAIGFVLCLHAHNLGDEPRVNNPIPAGDADPEVRAGVMKSLTSFQEGYTRRDLNSLPEFMQKHFDREGDILVLGTDESEWIRGYPAATHLVRNDWSTWGDLRLNLDNPIVSSSQNTAWMATDGEVRFGNRRRPLWFSAILVRNGDVWLFREMQFRWIIREPSPGEMLHSRLYLTLFSSAMRKFTSRPGAPSSGE